MTLYSSSICLLDLIQRQVNKRSRAKSTEELQVSNKKMVQEPANKDEARSQAIPKELSAIEAIVLKKIASHVVKMRNCKECTWDGLYTGKQIPLSMVRYLERLIRYANSWASDTNPVYTDTTGVRCAVIAIDYLKRVAKNGTFELHPETIHRSFAGAFLLALKFSDDFLISNEFWGKVAGFPAASCTRIEMDLMVRMKWNCTIHPDRYSMLKLELLE